MQLKHQQISIRSLVLYREIESLTQQAEVNEQQKQYAQAAALFEKAREQQQLFNQHFQGSRYASEQKVASLAARARTATGKEQNIRTLRFHQTVTQALRKGEPARAQDLLENMPIGLLPPKTPDETTSIQKTVAYLYGIRDALGAIHARLQEQWLSIPEAPNATLLRTEVTQGLFQQVMGENPSRRRGEGLLVESVTWNETQLFCEPPLLDHRPTHATTYRNGMAEGGESVRPATAPYIPLPTASPMYSDFQSLR